MQCPECNAENPANFRFCGMCGAKLARKPRLAPNPYFSDRVGEGPVMKQEFAAPDAAPPVAVAEAEESYGYPEPVREYRATPPAEVVAEREEPVVQRAPDPVRVAEPVREPVVVREERRPEPVVIGGSSLLGLGSPAEPLHSEAGQEDTSYLLEYERPRRTVSWRAWALLLVLIGLGYLGYREWALQHYRTRPDLSKVLAEGGQTSAPDTPVSNTGSAPAGNTQAQTSASAKPEGDAGAAGTPTAANAGTEAPKPSDTNAAAATTPKEAHPAKAPDSADTSAADAGPAKAKAGTSKPPAKAAASEDTGDAADVPQKTSKAAKSGAATPAAVDYGKDPMYTRAMQYIHGQPQNCEMGMNYLRAAADSNPRARIQLAALYQSGVCVPMDRAQAYSWYSKAQELDPHNMWLEKNRARLWEQMGAGERAKVH